MHYPYHSSITPFTLNSFDKLVSFVAAYKLAIYRSQDTPCPLLKRLYINAAYLNPYDLFVKEDKQLRLCHDLAETIISHHPCYLEVLSIRIDSVKHKLAYMSDYPSYCFEAFLGIRAKVVECTTADEFIFYSHCLQMLYLNPATIDTTAPLLANNGSLVCFRTPYMLFPDDNNGTSTVRGLLAATKQLRVLHLDWPLSLDNEAMANLLCGLQCTLLDKGLILDAPASIPSTGRAPRDLHEEFVCRNPDLSLMGIRAQLSARNVDVEALMKKLDWRVPDSELEAGD